MSTTIPFSDFSLDVVLEIFSWCGPLDLQALCLVSRLLAKLLAKNKYIWRLALSNLQLDCLLPATTNLSGASLVRYLFNGGPCTVCRRTTTELPHSFSLDIRICSAACSMYLLRLDINKCLQPDPAIFVKKADHAHNIYALLFGALPYLEGTADAPLYLSSAVHQVMEEFHDSTDSMLMAWARRASERPAYMASAETLQAAAASYRIKKETVEHKNRNFLAALAQRNGLTFDQLVSSPTLARHVNAFARDLTTLSDPIWMTICDASLAEIRARTSPNGGPVACPFLGCENRRSLESHSIEEHIRVVHPEQYVEIATSKHRCTLCPASGDARRYKINSLRQHVKDSHRSLRRDL